MVMAQAMIRRTESGQRRTKEVRLHEDRQKSGARQCSEDDGKIGISRLFVRSVGNAGQFADGHRAGWAGGDLSRPAGNPVCGDAALYRTSYARLLQLLGTRGR